MTTKSEDNPRSNAYATLLTRPSYLAGALVLAYSLHKHSPEIPLIIMYTPETLPKLCVKVVEVESLYSNCILRPVQHLRLPESGDNSEHGMVAERFIDTWTKLRAFELHDTNYSKICFLDADMLVVKDPSPIAFSSDVERYLKLENGRSVLATHVCVCNLDKDSWAPASWNVANCAYTDLHESSAPPAVQERPESHNIFNSGAMVFRPSEALAESVLDSFYGVEAEVLRKMKFPDQDFLNMVFRGLWKSLPWTINARKTWRYWHTNIWSDEKVRVIHYIVDKPWVKKLGEDGRAGYRGDDGETHRWWWTEYETWASLRKAQGEMEILHTTKQFVADGGEEKRDMTAIGSQVQSWAKPNYRRPRQQDEHKD